jgi:hypothetical protein
MTTFTIFPAGSVSAFGAGQHAFQRGATGSDGLVVQAGAFLTAAGTGAAGALLSGAGAWTARVDGSIVSAKNTGLAVFTGTRACRPSSSAPEGSIGSKTGLAAYSAVDILNAGTIAGRGRLGHPPCWILYAQGDERRHARGEHRGLAYPGQQRDGDQLRASSSGSSSSARAATVSRTSGRSTAPC